MVKQVINAIFDRENLGNINENFDELYYKVDNAVIEPVDGSITSVKLADASITSAKMNDNYASVKILDTGTDILSLQKEGLYLKQSGNTAINLPTELGDGSTNTLFITIKAFNPNFRSIEIIDTTNTTKTYSNFMRLGAPRGWRTQTEDGVIKKYALDTVNDKLQYNAQVFEKYSDGLIPDLNLLAANAVQELKIEGLDPEIPLKLWILSRNYANGSTNWNYRIMIAQKKDGVWSSAIDTGTGFTITESLKGSTLVKYQNGLIKLQARVNYNLLPQGGRVLDHDTLAEDPYFIIRPKNVSLTDNTIPDVEVYDQSLNTTDSVRFASIKADSIEVGGELKTGTIATPPTGIVKGDMWLDTTDSATHPILRVMS